jgi:regulator of protease activity HflC (stomatin/prohibitin superfamily)
MEFPLLEVIGIAAAVYSLSSLRIIKQYERGVSFFLGRYWNTKGPGLKFVPTGVAHMHRVSLRTVALDIPPQDVITRDNVSVKVNAVLYMRVKDPSAAIIQIENYLYATSQMAQTTLRSVLGEHQLDDLLAEREKINGTLKEIIDRRTDDWGIEVTAVEVKDVDLPPEMKRAMARQAEAERERRAKVIMAEGEFQAAEKLAAAAHIINTEPAALQLRYLQTMAEMSTERNTTTFFPLPMDLLKGFLPSVQGAQGHGGTGERASTPSLSTTAPRPSLPTNEPHGAPQIGAGEPLPSRREPHAG